VVYAGLRDPMWKIGQCLNSDIPNLLLQAKSSGHVYQHECVPTKTGYKGFLIQDTTDELLITGPETVQLQLLLLDTMPDELSPTGSYRQRIRNVITSGKVSADCPNTAGNESCVLPNSLDRWNVIEEIRRKNNGYSYVHSAITNSYAQPGRGTGKIYSQIATEAIKNAAARDGFVALSPHPTADEPVPSAPEEDALLVALFLSPGR